VLAAAGLIALNKIAQRSVHSEPALIPKRPAQTLPLVLDQAA